MLRGIARSQAGAPTARIRRLLADALGGLRVRLPAGVLNELAVAISAGRPVSLP